ncbi:MAG: type II toxin-antitoxin system RelE/ParE family toxin [Rhodomicrobium sp.]
MRVFKTRGFARFAKAEDIADTVLAKAVAQAQAELIDADLGGGLIKLRVARPGSGKRGGYRTLLAFRAGSRAIFLFGFAKSERENVSLDQLADLKAAAADILRRSDDGLAQDIAAGRLQEVDYEEED